MRNAPPEARCLVRSIMLIVRPTGSANRVLGSVLHFNEMQSVETKRCTVSN